MREFKDLKIAVAGTGYVGLSIATLLSQHHMDNVTFIPYQDKADLIYSLNASDVHWCVNAKGIKGVSCPSNVYSTNYIDVATSKRTYFAH